VIGGPLLRTADGRLFLAAQLMDSLSAGISLVALPWLVLDAGGTQSQAGAAFLAGTLPYVVLGLNAGHVGDHRPRRRVMVTGTAVQTAAAAVIPLALAGGVAVEDMPLALIYAAALVVTAGRVFVDAAAFGAIAKLVGGGHFVQGQSALSFVWSLGFLVGPAVGGALIGLVGISGALWVQAVGFAVAVGLMASMRVDLGPDPHPDAGGEGVLAGLRLVIRDPVLRSLTAIGMAWNLTTNVIYSLIVVFARHDLSADAGQAGLMLSIAGAAGLAGGLLAPVARHRLGPTRALRSSIALSGVGALGTALAQEIVSATIAYSVLEFSALLFITLLISERQTRAAPSEQGRVGITGRMAALTAASVGALIGAVLVALISLPAILLLAALCTIVVAGVGQRAIRV
jgi:MFS family permease